MPTVRLLYCSLHQLYRGVSDAPGGVVDANCLLLLRVGVGLLTAGRGPSGGVGSRGTGDVAVAHRLT